MNSLLNRMPKIACTLKRIALMALVCLSVAMSDAEAAKSADSVDRVEIAAQQIQLLKNRYKQSERELADLQRNDSLPSTGVEPSGKNVLDKLGLDIAVSKSNLESIDIELADAGQTVSWLEKNIREANNQLNVLKVFGVRIAKNEMVNAQRLHADLAYQEKLIKLEKERVKYLQRLQDDAASILQIKKNQLNKINSQLKSQRLLRIKQQEVRDELSYQEQQQQWLEKLNTLYARLKDTSPVTAKAEYRKIEDEIFNANEHASYAYAESLLARYRDQIQQLGSVSLKSVSIAQLNELRDQVTQLSKQMDKLGDVMRGREGMLRDHIEMATSASKPNHAHTMLPGLEALQAQYKQSVVDLESMTKQRDEFSQQLTKAMKTELSARQGFPTFSVKSLLDIGKEMLLVPALAFQVVKSLTAITIDKIGSASAAVWSIFAAAEVALLVVFGLASRVTRHLLQKPSQWREKINSKWLSLKWLDHHFMDLYLMSNIVISMFIFGIPMSNYIMFVYLAGVWFVFKSIIVIARICLVETINHNSGKDIRLYQRLKWIIGVGGVATAATVFVYQLPLIYELKTLADRLFLFFMMLVSIILLRFWDVVPNLILSHMEKRHPYFEKSIWLLGVLVPLLMFGNSIIGMLGYVNLVMSMSWYEGMFLLVLIGYLLLRGLLTDSVEQLSRVVIQHSNNGWLLTEAFLKPLDRLLRLSLIVMACVALFAVYGWNDPVSTIDRLYALLHYQLGVFYSSSITPLRMIVLVAVICTFYWTARWTREFVYRMLHNRTSDMGMRNSMAILSQYAVIVLGIIITLQVLGIDSRALAAVTAAFAFGVGLGLRDLANNFFCGFLILLERPVRVGDIIAVNDAEGEVISIGSRAVTIMTWDNMAYVVPNTEIFNKSFTNLTTRDNIVRCVTNLKIARSDNPHQVQEIIRNVITQNRSILSDPAPGVFLRELNDLLMNFELRYYVNLRQITSRTMVRSTLLIAIWDAFEQHGIKPPYPQQEIFLRGEAMQEPAILSMDNLDGILN